MAVTSEALLSRLRNRHDAQPLGRLASQDAAINGSKAAQLSVIPEKHRRAPGWLKLFHLDEQLAQVIWYSPEK
ncbi:hypothetical protein [Aminobacter aganoensis]|uniref:hypothetical protein n=1 Tax=Aminobacter aganoensis TaxID=83264 RepID=UPI0031E67BEF